MEKALLADYRIADYLSKTKASISGKTSLIQETLMSRLTMMAMNISRTRMLTIQIAAESRSRTCPADAVAWYQAASIALLYSF